MDYDFKAIEKKWRKHWQENNTYETKVDVAKPKYYGLTMFPYPSGAGLHVGHPLGYIASDIYARYKRLKGFNVLHPMGYDSFGLPAEQYAIQTGQHPANTTRINIDGCLNKDGEILPQYLNSDGSLKDEALIEKGLETNIKNKDYQQNIIKGYRNQLDKIGFSFDWSREVRTSDPQYYKWTQWIFKQLFAAYYCKDADKALPIENLVAVFEKEGNSKVNAVSACEIEFSAEEWKSFDAKKQAEVLMEYRLTYLADSWVNWCPALGTVLANDEIVNGVSERGGHPVEQKLMRQWSMRITAYAERLLKGLDKLDWSDAVKDIQRNWIGKSVGASLHFPLWRGIEGEDASSETSNDTTIQVFTTRPDTIFGVSFMVLAPEHELVEKITTEEYKDDIKSYQQKAGLKSERDRMSDIKTISGQFTGAYAVHPLSGEKIQIWIGDYVLASYGTGAVMAVPCGDQRDWDFAKHFEIPIKNIFADISIEEGAYTEKKGIIANSDFLNGLEVTEAIKKAIEVLEERNIGKAKTNFRLRDAVFSRQRYWGEPFPVYYDNGIPKTIEDQYLPIELPEVDKYLPTPDGKPPLGNASNWHWDSEKNELTSKDRAEEENVHPMELNTMPGWAGSSWYFLRYMDPHNDKAFVAKDKVDYWNNVDLYIGGAEHATGHLLYSRFWSMFLHDFGFIPFEEPFKKMINQGMILGNSAFANLINIEFSYKNDVNRIEKESRSVSIDVPSPITLFISADLAENSEKYANDWVNKYHPESKDIVRFKMLKKHVDINFLKGHTELDTNKLEEQIISHGFVKPLFILNHENKFIIEREVEKMSKSKFNVQNPDDLVEKYGADTLRMYEMFLGPLEQAKPWDIKGINGVNNFLRKLWRLFHDQEGNVIVENGTPDAKALKTMHKTIKKAQEDMDRYVFNTSVSAMMICVNELTDQKCHNKTILQDLAVILAPYAPHIAEELWVVLGNQAGTVSDAQYPVCNEEYLVEDAFEYPVSFNGKMRFKVELPNSLSKDEIEKEILGMEKSQHYLEGKTPKKVIVVPGRIVNIVV